MSPAVIEGASNHKDGILLFEERRSMRVGFGEERDLDFSRGILEKYDRHRIAFLRGDFFESFHDTRHRHLLPHVLAGKVPHELCLFADVLGETRERMGGNVEPERLLFPLEFECKRHFFRSRKCDGRGFARIFHMRKEIRLRRGNIARCMAELRDLVVVCDKDFPLPKAVECTGFRERLNEFLIEELARDPPRKILDGGEFSGLFPDRNDLPHGTLPHSFDRR